MKRLLIQFLTIAAALLFLEASSHLILSKIYNREFDNSIIEPEKYFTTAGLLPNKESIVWGKNFHTNEYGCRVNKVENNKAKQSRLFIGDSVTEGVGVDDTSTFASVSATELNDCRLLNYSLIGYSTADYVNVLNSVLPLDSSINSVTLFYCLNDVYSNTPIKDLPVMKQQNFLGKLNGILQNRCSTYKLIKLFFYQNSNRYFSYDEQFYTTNNRYFVRAMSDLRTCDSLCKRGNVPFNVVVLPYQSQLCDKNFRPQQLMKNFCANNSISFYDAAESFTNQINPNSFYLFADEIHFSEQGHRAIADYLLKHILYSHKN
jgi:lysophospholipase L1-like esterase